MCTLTIAPLTATRVRLAFNRDEQRSRPAGCPPKVRSFGSRRAVLPTDPPSGGTWLAVNNAALVLAVLNVNPGMPVDAHPSRSRGEIIPSLLGCDSPASALDAFEGAVDYHHFAPFRLVILGHGIVADVRWDGRAPMVSSQLLGTAPRLYTSSGLGDAAVEPPRRALFEETFAGSPSTWVEAQDTFHRSRWPGREHLSVNMTRPDARTVSLAVIDLEDDVATFEYHADGPDAPVRQSALVLSLAAVGVI